MLHTVWFWGVLKFVLIITLHIWTWNNFQLSDDAEMLLQRSRNHDYILSNILNEVYEIGVFFVFVFVFFFFVLFRIQQLNWLQFGCCDSCFLLLLLLSCYCCCCWCCCSIKTGNLFVFSFSFTHCYTFGAKLNFALHMVSVDCFIFITFLFWFEIFSWNKMHAIAIRDQRDWCNWEINCIYLIYLLNRLVAHFLLTIHFRTMTAKNRWKKSR